MREAEAECAPAVDAAGCEPPLTWPADAPAAGVFVDELTSRFVACGVEPDDVRFDCSEFPCLVYAHQRVASTAYECLGAPPPLPEEVPAGLPPELTPIIAALDRNRPNHAAAIEDRMWGRALRLSARLSTHGRVVPGAFAPSCDEADRLLGMPLCEAHQAFVGCETQPELAILEEDRRAHVASAQRFVENLQARCPVFADSSWFLDCERTPCVLGVDRSDLEGRGLEIHEFMCTDPILGTAGFHTNRNHGRAVAMFPLVGLEDGDLADVLRDRWDAQRPRRWEDLGSYLGADRPASPGVEQ
jgi:hypothetical protein